MLKYGLVFLLLVAGILWVTQVHPVFAVGTPTATATASNKPLSVELEPLTAGGIASERVNTQPPFDGDGVVFIDTADGTPQTPYIAYETPKNQLAIKELVFIRGDEQPCQVSAGEYPCVPNIDGEDGANSDASPVPSGTPVHLVGTVDDQGVVVSSLDPASSAPTGMVLFSTPVGGTSQISNGTILNPTGVLTDASCTLGVGCFGTNTKRLEITMSSGDSTKTTELVPGTLFSFGNSTIILLSITGSGSSAVANFLVASR